MLRVPLLQKFIQWLIETSEEPLDRSYLFFRTGIGFVGVALPIVLIFGRMLLERQFGILDSMCGQPVGDWHFPHLLSLPASG